MQPVPPIRHVPHAQRSAGLSIIDFWRMFLAHCAPNDTRDRRRLVLGYPDVALNDAATVMGARLRRRAEPAYGLQPHMRPSRATEGRAGAIAREDS